jgi:bacteriocin-like protein
MTEETAKKKERDPKDSELDKKETDELSHEELSEVSGGFIVRP